MKNNRSANEILRVKIVKGIYVLESLLCLMILEVGANI